MAPPPTSLSASAPLALDGPQKSSILATYLEKNEQWANDVQAADRTFFKQSALGQSPKVLWIGCSDSRVPETTLLAARPGDIFVHRNIANQYQDDDDSAHAALQYSVDACGVQDIFVVGHTVCGGCKAAWGADEKAAEDDSTPLSRFIGPLIALRHSLPAAPADSSSSAASTVQTLIEANVLLSVGRIADSPTVRANWALKGVKGVQVHGLIYELATGKLRDLGVSRIPAGSETDQAIVDEVCA